MTEFTHFPCAHEHPYLDVKKKKIFVTKANPKWAKYGKLY